MLLDNDLPVEAFAAPRSSHASRLRALADRSPTYGRRADELVQLAARGLPQMQLGDIGYVQTVRGDRQGRGKPVPEGDSLRYTANVALGLSGASQAFQRSALGGRTAIELTRIAMDRALQSRDFGAVALAAWAGAETSRVFAGALFDRLRKLLVSGDDVQTVICAWILSSAVAARHLGDTDDIVALAAKRLAAAQSPSGLFPRMTPPAKMSRLRAHVGCFADQVYPIQALARLALSAGDSAALDRANACAERICALQGPAGQWWWHYDVRNGSVLERYPVYSVHQHAMAPMALLDLWEAGGNDHWQSVIKGLDWLDRHPEVDANLIADESGVVWRKVGRREPRKAVRSISAVTTAMHPGLYLPGLDAVFPPNQVDYECRPYEFAWMFYAWLSTLEGGRSVQQ